MKKFFMIMAVAAVCAGFASCGSDKKGCDESCTNECENCECTGNCAECDKACAEGCTCTIENCECTEPCATEEPAAEDENVEVVENQVAEGMAEN